MGRRQVVRHLVLVQAFGGSNPSAPEFKSPTRAFFSMRKDENHKAKPCLVRIARGS